MNSRCVKNLYIKWQKNVNLKRSYKKISLTLAGVAQWTECRPANQKVTGLIPSQGTCLGCRPGLQLGADKRQLINVSLTHQCFSLSLPPLMSKNK